jgi:XTP/dITP diphosphohydrolase
LNGAPGVHSARYSGDERNDLLNIEKLLRELKGVTNRRARFKTVITLFYNKQEIVFEGIIKGTITTELRGVGGFGYDPVFIPQGHEKTFAEMSQKDKNRISHRAIAVDKMIDFLNKNR